MWCRMWLLLRLMRFLCVSINLVSEVHRLRKRGIYLLLDPDMALILSKRLQMLFQNLFNLVVFVCGCSINITSIHVDTIWKRYGKVTVGLNPMNGRAN